MSIYLIHPIARPGGNPLESSSLPDLPGQRTPAILAMIGSEATVTSLTGGRVLWSDPEAPTPNPVASYVAEMSGRGPALGAAAITGWSGRQPCALNFNQMERTCAEGSEAERQVHQDAERHRVLARLYVAADAGGHKVEAVDGCIARECGCMPWDATFEQLADVRHALLGA